MGKEVSRNIRVGVVVIVSTLLLIIALYFIGDKQNLFGSTFRISAEFHNVNGLTKGNNVRLAGINVGTVEKVNIINDSTVKVVLIIQKKVQVFIKKNAIASVGTDGLMGNKLVDINSGMNEAPTIEEGDILESRKPIEMDAMIRTLDMTNENMRVVTYNLREITDKINSKNSLWNLLMDTVVAENVKSSVVNLKLMTNQTIMVTGNLKEITDGIKNGKGSIGALIMDTSISSNIRQTIVKLERISDTAAIVSGDISYLVRRLKQGQGSIGVLMTDTTLVYNLNKSVESIGKSSQSFNDNMEALKHSWPLKKYFRKQDKSKLKNQVP